MLKCALYVLTLRDKGNKIALQTKQIPYVEKEDIVKKKLLLVVLTLAIFTLAVAGCSIIGKDKNDHVHTGGEATCLVKARCTDCGELYGELAPHTYNDATCLAPKICTVCRHTEGSKADHRWQEQPLPKKS